jgi:hypothetical protein
MKGVKVNIDNVNVSNSFEMVKTLLRVVCITKSLFLSETELHALTYFVINGYSKISRENLVTTKLLKNKSSVANLVHDFRKYGVIVKNSMGEELNPDFNVNVAEMDAVKIEMTLFKK